MGDDRFYLSAFWDLNSCRNYDGGPIPWTAIMQYGYNQGFDRDMVEALVHIVRHVDRHYLEWHGEERERQARQRVRTDSSK